MSACVAHSSSAATQHHHRHHHRHQQQQHEQHLSSTVFRWRASTRAIKAAGKAMQGSVRLCAVCVLDRASSGGVSRRYATLLREAAEGLLAWGGLSFSQIRRSVRACVIIAADCD